MADKVHSWTSLFVRVAGNYWSEIKVLQEERSRKEKTTPPSVQRSILVLQLHTASIKMPPAHPGCYLELHRSPELTGCIKYTFNEAGSVCGSRRLKKWSTEYICSMPAHNRGKGIHFIRATSSNFHNLVGGVLKCSN